MKRITITLTFLLFLLLSVKAQTIHFFYDTDGNRELRTIIRVEKITEADTVFNASVEKEILPVKSISGLRVYPNPAGAVVNIEFAILPQTPVEYTFTDISGRLLNECIITSALTPLNLQNIGKGVYVLQVRAGSDKEKFKIIKQ